MPTYFARSSGNINGAIWATTPTGTAGAVTFDPSDILVSNSFTITVNVSVTVTQVTNTTTGGATAGGVFQLQNGVTLSAAVFGGTATCVSSGLASGSSASIVGNVSVEANGTAAGTVANNSSGTLNITGAVSYGGASNSCSAVLNSSTGIINIVGNVSFPANTGGSQPSPVINISSGTINITGNVTGAFSANGVGAVDNRGALGTVNITGNVTGGGSNTAYGATNTSTGTLSIVGTVTAGSATNSEGARNTSSGTLAINGTLQATNSSPAVTGSAGLIYLTGPFLCASNGRVANAATIWRWNSTLNPTTFIQIPTSDLSTTRNFVTPDNVTGMPAASNVRSGVSYASGALTGTCAVPPASSVLTGVPVDNTVGTSSLSSAGIQSACEAALSAFSGGRLAACATVASTGQQLADALTP